VSAFLEAIVDQSVFCGFSNATGSYLLALCQAAEKVYNIEASDLLQICSLTPESLSKDKKTIPVFYIYSVIMHVVKATEDEMVAFKLAQHFDLKAFDTLGYLLMHCDTIGEGLARVQRFERLALEHSITSIESDGSIARVSWTCNYENDGSRFFRELIVTGWISMVNRMLDSHLGCKEVHFEHPPPETKNRSLYQTLAEYETFYGCPVLFNSHWSGVAFQQSYLAMPFGDSDPRLRSIMEEYAELMLTELDLQNTFLTEARETMYRQILNGEVHFETFAEKMCLSTRALQARFQKIGMTYCEMMDEIRRMLALIYLEDESLSLLEVAILLAYNDQSSFARAFKRWTGETPRRYRQRIASLESIYKPVAGGFKPDYKPYSVVCMDAKDQERRHRDRRKTSSLA